MDPRIDDLRIEQTRPLVSPAILIEEIPLSPKAAEMVSQARRDVEAVLAGEDKRLMVIVGPCSIHDPDAALEYGKKLKAEADRLADDLLIVMRAYFEKPRTTVGWKGFIYDPELSGSHKINRGLRDARTLLSELTDLGLPLATEYLDMTVPQYISDFICWGCVGARTSASQPHRELASGLSMPVGFKNPTEGRISTAIEGVIAAREPHWFASNTKDGVAAHFRSRGNPSCHIVLRGGKDTGPNYDKYSIGKACDQLAAEGLAARVMVDASHDNSGKDLEKQKAVVMDLAKQITEGSESISGVMMESFLVGGRQNWPECGSLAYGMSITDPCLSFDETVPLLDALAEAVRSRK
jgi:3-deoxy-7-phosphoheptulonate synthase